MHRFAVAVGAVEQAEAEGLTEQAEAYDSYRLAEKAVGACPPAGPLWPPNGQRVLLAVRFVRFGAAWYRQAGVARLPVGRAVREHRHRKESSSSR
jgi:hypothetical protein